MDFERSKWIYRKGIKDIVHLAYLKKAFDRMANKQIYICFIKRYYIDETVLNRAVYKIPWLSEVRRLKSGILPVIPNGDQFFLEQ